MPSLSTLLGLAAVITALIDAKPIFNGKELRQLDNGFAKRQDGEGEDVDTEAIDALRHAVDYASVFSAQSTATYSAVSVGSAPSEATLVATTTVAPGTKAVGSPPEPREQGDKYVVDHILELQFVVGAFSVNTRPTSIPLENWNAVSSACFSPAPKNYPPRTAVASAFGQAFNLQGIPSRFNGFKGQVFAGRFKSNPDNPSGRTYPADFGPALRKFLEENEQDFYSAMDDVGEALAGDGVGNYPGIKDYFTAYAQAEFQSATEFLSTWIGTSYTRTSTATSTSSTVTSSSVRPLTDCSLVQTTLTGTIASGPQTYCQCGPVIAGINTETSGSLVYSVCAGAPYPTIATSTVAAPPASPTCDCNENGCTENSPACCGDGTCDGNADAPPDPPDLSSPACTSCTSTLGASDCSADDDQCLIDQCKADKDCQACRIDCNTFGSG